MYVCLCVFLLNLLQEYQHFHFSLFYAIFHIHKCFSFPDYFLFIIFIFFLLFSPFSNQTNLFYFLKKFISASILLNLLLISADSWHLNKISPHPQQPAFPTHLVCGCPIHSHNCTFLKPTLLAGMHTRSKTCTKVDNL